MEDLFGELRQEIDLLSKSLPKQVDSAAISQVAKTPYKVLVIRESALWRIEEISRCSFAALNAGDTLTGIILARASAETSALCWYLKDQVEARIRGKYILAFDETMMRLLMGNKNWEEMPDPINVLKMLDKADRQIPGIRDNYNALSEYAHPNHLGMSQCFAENDYENILTNFSRYPVNRESRVRIGVNGLSASLAVFRSAYEAVGSMIPELVKVCEAEISTRNRH